MHPQVVLLLSLLINALTAAAPQCWDHTEPPPGAPEVRYLYNPLRELWERNGSLPLRAASLGERAAALCVSMGSCQAFGLKRSSNRFYIDREE